MAAAISIFDARLYYRVRHPEFDPRKAYRAVGYLAHSETSWNQLLFITDRGLTYTIKVFNTLNVNALCNDELTRVLNLPGGGIWPVAVEIMDDAIAMAPWPRARGKNPEIEDD
jgi:hypothetical protein